MIGVRSRLTISFLLVVFLGVALTAISVLPVQATTGSVTEFGDDDGDFGDGDFGDQSETGNNSISVTAVDENDNPLTETYVFGYCGNSSAEAATNSEGIATLTGLTAGNCSVQLNSNFEYYSTPKNLVIPVTDDDSENIETTVVGTPTDTMLTINVNDADGAPIADGTLGSLVDTEGRRFSASTDNGQLMIRLFYGTHTLYLTPEDTDQYLSPTSFEITDDPATQEVTVQLSEKTSTITGNVVDQNGGEIESPFVILFSEHGIIRSMGEETGAFSQRVEPGTYTIKTDKTGYANAAVQNIVVGEDESVDVGTIELGEATNTVNLQLVDSNSNNMLISGMVFCENTNTPTDPASKYFSRFSEGSASFTFPDGVFACSPMINGYVATTDTSFDVSGGSTTNANVTLEQYNATITVSIVDEFSEPISNADVGVTAQTDDGISINGFNYSNDSSVTIQAVGGTYSIRPFMQSGSYTFAPDSIGEVTVEDNGSEEISITAYGTSSTITGTITDADNTPVEGAKVKLVSDQFEFTGTSNSAGEYSVNVVAGTYLANAAAEGYPLPAGESSVTVEANATVENNMQLQGSTSTLTVTPSGNPDSGSCYAYKDDGSYVTSVLNDEGVAELPIVDGDWTYGCRTVENDTVNFTASEDTSTITDANDASVNAAVIDIEDQYENLLYQFSSGSDTSFTLPDGTEIFVPAGALDTASGNVSIIASIDTDVAVEGDEFPAHAIKLTALDVNSNPIEGNFNNSVSITFHYDEATLTALGISEDDLIARTYKGGAWIVTNSGNTVDTENNTISVSTNHFSSFGILGVKSDISAPAKIKRSQIHLKKRKASSVLINWADITNATSYKLALAKKANNHWKNIQTKNNVLRSKYAAKKLHSDTTYRVKLKACNIAGCSAWSSWKKFTTKK